MAFIYTRERDYQLVTPEDKKLFTADFGKIFYPNYGFFSVADENGPNKTGLMDSAGKLVVLLEYSDYEVQSDRYCVAVIREETNDDAYDYGSGMWAQAKSTIMLHPAISMI